MKTLNISVNDHDISVAIFKNERIVDIKSYLYEYRKNDNKLSNNIEKEEQFQKTKQMISKNGIYLSSPTKFIKQRDLLDQNIDLTEKDAISFILKLKSTINPCMLKEDFDLDFPLNNYVKKNKEPIVKINDYIKEIIDLGFPFNSDCLIIPEYKMTKEEYRNICLNDFKKAIAFVKNKDVFEYLERVFSNAFFENYYQDYDFSLIERNGIPDFNRLWTSKYQEIAITIKHILLTIKNIDCVNFKINTGSENIENKKEDLSVFEEFIEKMISICVEEVNNIKETKDINENYNLIDHHDTLFDAFALTPVLTSNIHHFEIFSKELVPFSREIKSVKSSKTRFSKRRIGQLFNHESEEVLSKNIKEISIKSQSDFDNAFLNDDIYDFEKYDFKNLVNEKIDYILSLIDAERLIVSNELYLYLLSKKGQDKRLKRFFITKKFGSPMINCLKINRVLNKENYHFDTETIPRKKSILTIFDENKSIVLNSYSNHFEVKKDLTVFNTRGFDFIFTNSIVYDLKNNEIKRVVEIGKNQIIIETLKLLDQKPYILENVDLPLPESFEIL